MKCVYELSTYAGGLKSCASYISSNWIHGRVLFVVVYIWMSHRPEEVSLHFSIYFPYSLVCRRRKKMKTFHDSDAIYMNKPANSADDDENFTRTNFFLHFILFSRRHFLADIKNMCNLRDEIRDSMWK